VTFVIERIIVPCKVDRPIVVAYAEIVSLVVGRWEFMLTWYEEDGQEEH
jgi:hypothetical protein